MASQDTTATAAEIVTGNQYPDYDGDSATFASFVLEHTIRRVVRGSGDGSDSEGEDGDQRLFEPTGETGASGEAIRVERVPCYPRLLQKIADRDYPTDTATTFLVEVPLSELVAWDSVRGGDLCERAAANGQRYHSLFCTVLDGILRDSFRPSGGVTRNPRGRGSVLLRDAMDVLQEQRMALHRQAQQQQDQQQEAGVEGDAANAGGGDERNAFPPLLMRRYELRILPLGRRGSLFPFEDQYHPSKAAAAIPRGVSLRHVRSKSMGRLVTITGMIVKASDVRPMLQVAAYTCDVCGSELYKETHRQRDFVPEKVCPVCVSGGTNPGGGGGRRVVGVLKLETRGSKFTKFQELKLQELPSQVPMGHIPRSLSVYCRGELTRLASPGDVVTLDGIFLPQKVNDGHGAAGRRAGLMSTLYVDAQNLSVHKKSFDDAATKRAGEEKAGGLDADVRRVASAEDPVGVLSRSIAPEIFGHADIKRALLLQLTGGVFRKMADGMKIRGDINICLMGDPGVAKSQLLKHVVSVAPRGVYTTGKGSSGVGLTASVTKDNTTGELSLEGGALVLADRGICAIDEFDKMDEADRSSIHEVMEQQTVSIAKAGIVATLNARASVLAAANPLYSRYNRHKSLSENINLPNSLLSRFDLMFLILDTPDMDRDMALARHVTFVHQNEGLEAQPEDLDSDDDDDSGRAAEENSDFNEEKGIVSPRLLREYISRARRHDPVVPPEVAPYIVEAYVSLRMQDRPGKSNNGNKVGDQTVMTARQLLSILRLGQALARLRFSDYVAREDVDEAIRLTHMSKASLSEETGEDGKIVRREDVMSRIFNIIRDYSATSNSTTVEMKLAEAMVIRKGFTVQQMQSCLEEYEALEIIQINQNRTQIHFIS
ncbi:unnamed protein product [Pseudo-nitzschia multistriata]|uniref:DNA replication licensing factor MCM4 n=1 Tax=Pseudo-nitzschia multistriata TaxID=183589 RepID=A0A448ZPP7_9STRA|nr:unnamed protein product [Pseudo-nitzschia multistriata]